MTVNWDGGERMDSGEFGRRDDDGDFRGMGEEGGWRMMCVAFGRVGWWIEGRVAWCEVGMILLTALSSGAYGIVGCGCMGLMPCIPV